MAKPHTAEQWNKARALYMAGKTYKEAAEETGISQARLREKGAKEQWKEQRNKNHTKTIQKTDEKIAEQAAENTASVLAPLKEASAKLVQKALELMPTADRAGDVRALAGAIKDLSQVIRDLNGVLTYKEELQLQQEKNEGTDVRFIIETEYLNGDD